jgi:hypothetical protein
MIRRNIPKRRLSDPFSPLQYTKFAVLRPLHLFVCITKTLFRTRPL